MTQESADLAARLLADFDEQACVAAATRAAVAGPFARTLAAAIACIRGGGKILLFGNGGSAAQAQHLATDLIVRYRDNRDAIAAIALSADTAVLTAGGNDFGFDRIFARQIEGLGRPGDMAFGFSTSGKSRNVNLALETARAGGLAVAGMSGGDGGAMAALVPDLMIVPSATVARIQEMHLTLGHLFCIGLERGLGLVK